MLKTIRNTIGACLAIPSLVVICGVSMMIHFVSRGAYLAFWEGLRDAADLCLAEGGV